MKTGKEKFCLNIMFVWFSLDDHSEMELSFILLLILDQDKVDVTTVYRTVGQSRTLCTDGFANGHNVKVTVLQNVHKQHIASLSGVLYPYLTD